MHLRGRPRHDMRGPRNWNWRGGTSNDRQRAMGRYDYKLWRAAVLKRDRYRCVLCEATGRLEANHIVPWREAPDRRYDVANGVALCAPCHRNIHGRELDFAPRFHAHVAAQPLAPLTAEELARLRPISQVCAWCWVVFVHRKSPRRVRQFHFCRVTHRRAFGHSIGHDWRTLHNRLNVLNEEIA